MRCASVNWTRDRDRVAAVLPQRDAAGHRLDVRRSRGRRSASSRRSRSGCRTRSRGSRAGRGPGRRPRCAARGSRAARARRPGMWRSSHSCCSRTSMTTARASPLWRIACDLGRVDLGDLFLDLAEKVLVVDGHLRRLVGGDLDSYFKKYSEALRCAQTANLKKNTPTSLPAHSLTLDRALGGSSVANV